MWAFSHVGQCHLLTLGWCSSALHAHTCSTAGAELYCVAAPAAQQPAVLHCLSLSTHAWCCRPNQATAQVCPAAAKWGCMLTSAVAACMYLLSAAVQAAGQQVQQRAACELHVEPPFALACRMSAAPRHQSLLVRGSSPDGALTLGQEATVLPVGEPAVLSATLRVTAPCEVSLCAADSH